jgi:hypothetical protein
MTRRRTNTAFLRDVMEHSPTGALMQAFVLEALRRYADAVAAADPADLDSALISGTAWHKCATHLQAALAAHLAD